MVNYFARTMDAESKCISLLYGKDPLLDSVCEVYKRTRILQIGNMNHSLDIFSCKVLCALRFPIVF